MSRKRQLRRKVARKVYIYEDLDTRLCLLLYDPLRGKIAYGKRDALINQLLQEYLDGLKPEEKDTGE